MGETKTVSEMAEIISSKIFRQFLWGDGGVESPTNVNWDCVQPEKHKTRGGKGKKQHPTDVVFWYDEPYSPSRTYLNTDLKSYASGSIKPAFIKKALKDLALAVSCANLSPEWQDKFIHGGVSPIVSGLLFIYNHDGPPDQMFRSMIVDATKGLKLDLPKGSRIYILGPNDIYRLNNIALDITTQRGEGKIPVTTPVSCYYPNLIRRKLSASGVVRAATVDALTAPWIPLEFVKADGTRCLMIYYQRAVKDRFEFIYLLDYLLHYQLTESHREIRIRYCGGNTLAKGFFKKAIEEYVRTHGDIDESRSAFDKIDFQTIRNIETSFPEYEISMKDD